MDELPRGAYLGGRFHRIERPDGSIDLASPADLSDRLEPFPWSIESARAAVAAARASAASWALSPLEERIAALRRLSEAFGRHAEAGGRARARE
ncbi:MAG: hypothetical protein ACYCWW_13800, partial [Deltaproteobacteria bacterium]